MFVRDPERPEEPPAAIQTLDREYHQITFTTDGDWWKGECSCGWSETITTSEAMDGHEQLLRRHAGYVFAP